MKTLHTIAYHKMFATLANLLKAEVKFEENEYKIFVNNAMAFGKISGVLTNSSKLLLEIDLKCHADLVLPFQLNSVAPLHFIYCQKDSFSIASSVYPVSKSIEEFQTAIFIRKNDPLVLKFTENSQVKSSIVIIDSEMASTMHEEINIYQFFHNKMKEGAYEYVGSHNLKITEQFARLKELDENGIVRKLVIEGTVQLVLAMEIQNHQFDLDPENQPCNSLTKTELKKIQKLGMDIKESPEQPYCIKELTVRSGISAAKLQEGFKHLFGRTVTDYIKNIRIELAERMIKTTDYTISEIVYSIGFTSRSYFSKIFRERYNCSPRAYQANQRYQAISA